MPADDLNRGQIPLYELMVAGNGDPRKAPPGTGLAAHLRALAEPDREVVALVAAGRIEAAPVGRGLEGSATAGVIVLGSVPGGVAALAGVGRLARQRSVGSDDSWPVVTDLDRQYSLGQALNWALLN